MVGIISFSSKAATRLPLYLQKNSIMELSSKFYSNIKKWCLEDIENRGAIVILAEKSNEEQDECDASLVSCAIGDEVLISGAFKHLMNSYEEENAVGRCMRAAVISIARRNKKQVKNEQHYN